MGVTIMHNSYVSTNHAALNHNYFVSLIELLPLDRKAGDGDR